MNEKIEHIKKLFKEKFPKAATGCTESEPVALAMYSAFKSGYLCREWEEEDGK